MKCKIYKIDIIKRKQMRKNSNVKWLLSYIKARLTTVHHPYYILECGLPMSKGLDTLALGCGADGHYHN